MNLLTLKWGDEIYIYAWGARYTYQIQSVEYFAPGDLSVLGQEEYDTLPLLTCQGYDEGGGCVSVAGSGAGGVGGKGVGDDAKQIGHGKHGWTRINTETFRNGELRVRRCERRGPLDNKLVGDQ